MAEFDVAAAHRRFAVDCYNDTWNLIEKADRTADETEDMIHMAHASRWHWSRREDRTPRNDSIAAWQLSRVYVLAGHVDQARRFGRECLDLAAANGLEPFFVAYGHEALARAEALAGNQPAAAEHRAAAARLADEIDEEEDRRLLLDDLSSLGD